MPPNKYYEALVYNAVHSFSFRKKRIFNFCVYKYEYIYGEWNFCT